MAETLLTRYLIFETDEDAVAFNRIGEVLANGSEEAVRKFHADPPVDREGFIVAVSENAFKLRKTKATVKTSVSDVDLPDLVPPTPVGAASADPPPSLPEA